MIVKRGEGIKHWSRSLWSYDVGFSTGLTPKGKVRPPVVVMSYTTFKKMSGIALKPGEAKEVEMVEL